MHHYEEPRKRYNFSLSEATWEAIARHAAMQGLSTSEVVNRALGWYVELLKDVEETMQADAKQIQSQHRRGRF